MTEFYLRPSAGTEHCMSRHRLALVAGAVAAMICGGSTAFAQTAPSLGSALSFGVLGGSAVTNTGPTVVNGDLGVGPGSAVSGFPPGIVTPGTIHAADAAAAAAQVSVGTAYDNITSQPCTQNLTGQNLGGLTLTSGVYCFDSSAQLTGALTLDAQGNSNAVFIFKIGSTLTTASGAAVILTNGGSVCNIFWQVGSSATLGTTTSFTGNILAATSITLTTGASVLGRALARNGAVTLDANNVSATCATALPVCPTIGFTPATLPGGTVGVAYSQAITATGGVGPYAFVVTSGTLPAGVTLSGAGLLAGTPTAAGSSSVTIRADDVNGCSGSFSSAIAVAAAPPVPPGCPAIALAPTALPNGTLGVAYNQTIVASGGTGAYTFGLDAGTLPPGITLTAAGVLGGTPTAAGQSAVTIRATDATGCPASVPYTLSILSAVPILPRTFVVLLVAVLMCVGYARLRRRAGAR